MKLHTSVQRRELLENELKRIVEIIIKDYKPERIFLFGSLTDGNIHEWSDIDMLIIKRTTKRPIDRILEVCNLIKPQLGIDLFIYTPEEFDMLQRERFSFFTNIKKSGKILYEKGS